MKIGTLEQHCGNCILTEFCGNAFCFCLCNNEKFKDVDAKTYKEIAEKAETIHYPECIGCDEDVCDGCPCDDEARDFFCEQVAEKVEKELQLN